MPTLGAPLDFAKLEGRNFRGHLLGAAPSSPVTGQLYYNTGDNTLYWWDGTAWVSARGGAAATPPATTGALGTVQLAGDLAGTATSPQIAAGVITDADVNAANKDGAVGTASMRTLGSGAAQAMPGNRTLDAITPPVGTINMNNQKLTGLANPTGSTESANKGYVDAATSGLDPKPSCRAASTANVNISAPGATMDGVTLAVNDRVLLKNQTTTNQNGIYVWGGAAVIMSRAQDADVSSEVTSGLFTFIEEGTVNGNTGWMLTTDNPILIDSTGLTFTQFSGAGEYTAGAGLLLTGTTFDVGGTAGRISVGTDTVDIAATYIGLLVDNYHSWYNYLWHSLECALQLASSKWWYRFFNCWCSTNRSNSCWLLQQCSYAWRWEYNYDYCRYAWSSSFTRVDCSSARQCDWYCIVG